MASLLSLLVIFLLLFQEFKSLKTTTIILLNLPLALIGGVFSIWLTSGILSIPAIIGFITLFGVATRTVYRRVPLPGLAGGGQTDFGGHHGRLG